MEAPHDIQDRPSGQSQQFCLRWKYHHSNLQLMFAQLLERESYCDVTLACEGKTLRAHKVVLSACSSYFDLIFSKHEEKDPIVILKDVKFNDIKALVEFMYTGEITVDNARLNTLLQIAEELRIKGLAAVSWRPEEGGWRSVEPDNKDSSLQSQNFPSLVPNLIAKKRKNNEFESIKSKKLCSTSPIGLEGQEDISESCEEDSEEAVWDTQSHEEVYSESEDFKMMDNECPVNRLCIPTVIEGEGTVNTGADQAAAYSDVVKMTAYIQQGGRRPHFWETASTKRVMEAIKKKEIEMKVAAELLGVSYGTLYGRYRDAYGCLKHPYRVRDFWHEPPSVEVINKLQKKELSLFKAAEILNVTVTTLANYLATLGRDGSGHSALHPENGGTEPDSVASAQQALIQNPDITIVKKELQDEIMLPSQIVSVHPHTGSVTSQPTAMPSQPIPIPTQQITLPPQPVVPMQHKLNPTCLNGSLS